MTSIAHTFQVILKGARANFRAEGVAEDALDALACLAGRDHIMHYHMAQMFVVSFVQDALRAFGAVSPRVVAHGCHLIAQLSLHVEVRALLNESGVANDVLTGANAYPHDPGAQHYACRALANLLDVAGGGGDKLRSAARTLAYQAASTHARDADVLKAVCVLLSRLCVDGKGTPQPSKRSVKIAVIALASLGGACARPFRCRGVRVNV
jgi:hypothetical protein